MSNAVNAELQGGKIAVRFAYSPARVKAIKDVSGRKFVSKEKSEDGKAYWTVPLDLETGRRLREAFGADLSLGEKLVAWGREEVQRETKLKELSQADDAELAQINEELSDWLRPYQRADIAFMATANVLNANQPRTGKTPETIVSLIEAGLAGDGQFHLVVAPVTSLRTTWERSILAIYHTAGLPEPIVLTGDTPDERREAVEAAVEFAEAADEDDNQDVWVVLNPYSIQLRSKFVEKVAGDPESRERVEELVEPKLLDVPWTSITIDEFHLMGLSNPATNGHKGALQIAEVTQPERKFALSGTPMGGKPIKLWGALRFLDPEQFSSRWNWARQWLVINNNGYGSSIEGIMPGREPAFYEHLKPFLVRRTRKNELPGLPEEVVENIWVEMSAKQAEQYRHFELEAEWKLEDDEENGRLTASNILAAYTRLKQFASGFCKVYRKANDEIEVKVTEDSPKLDALLEKLGELGVTDPDGETKAVVVSQFRPMVEMICDALNRKGIAAEKIYGGTKQSDRTRIQDEFQGKVEREDGETLRVVVLNTIAGGTAITLDAADNVHLLDETWVPDNQEQAADRIVPTNDEVAAKRTSTGHYYYRTKGTIEQYIQRLVADKALNNKTILDLRRRMQEEAAKIAAEEAAA